jgi:hypothetical protein
MGDERPEPEKLNFGEQRKKWIAEYQSKVGTWQFKETIEERIQAWREEQELASRARCAQLFEMPARKPLPEEELERYIEEASEWLGLDTCEVRKWFIPKKDKPRTA